MRVAVDLSHLTLISNFVSWLLSAAMALTAYLLYHPVVSTVTTVHHFQNANIHRIECMFPRARYTGFYRVYQLISQPFLIAVRKTVNVVSSTGINLFTVTIIAVFKENAASDLEMVWYLLVFGPILITNSNHKFHHKIYPILRCHYTHSSPLHCHSTPGNVD